VKESVSVLYYTNTFMNLLFVVFNSLDGHGHSSSTLSSILLHQVIRQKLHGGNRDHSYF